MDRRERAIATLTDKLERHFNAYRAAIDVVRAERGLPPMERDKTPTSADILTAVAVTPLSYLDPRLQAPVNNLRATQNLIQRLYDGADVGAVLLGLLEAE